MGEMRTSESIENIAKALTAFQSDIQNPKVSKEVRVKTKKGGVYTYDYAPLDEILKEFRPLLAGHGLAIMQLPSGDGQSISVSTLLIHESGEYIQSPPLNLRPESSDPQGAGSAITYARRYSLSAVLGIASEEDDDASMASGRQGSRSRKSQPKQDNKVSKPQLGKMFALVGEIGMDVDKAKETMYERFNVKSSKELTVSQASEFIEWLEIKKREQS